MAFVSYVVATIEQLAFVRYLASQGRPGMVKASMLFYLVVMMGIYGVLYLLPIPGWMSTSLENKLYCFGDASFKLGTSMMVLATNDLLFNDEMHRRANALEADFSHLLHTASVPIFGTDCQGNINQWNRKAAELTGLPGKYVLGAHLSSLLPSSRSADCEAMMTKALANDEPGFLEVTMELLDSKKTAAIPVNVRTPKLMLSAAPLMNNMGVTTGVTFIGCDLTEVAAFKDAEARKTRFMAIVSHELRSPLHGIIGLMDRLCESEEDETRARQMNMVLSCAKRLLDLVISIMDMASMASQTSKQASKSISQDPVELPMIVEEVALLVRSSVDKRGKPLLKPDVQLINEVGTIPVIEGDAHKCTQVIYNLITNACKFTTKGSVTVSSEVDPNGKWVEVSVTDTGVGIAKDALDRIFEPFEQEDASHARCHEGIGLGLSIAKQVVERHGGRIRVRSQLGVGSTFTIRLPAVMLKQGASPDVQDGVGVVVSNQSHAALQTASILEPPKGRSDSSRKPLVLSVDDEEMNQIVVREALKVDFDVDVAMDGRQALQYLKSCATLPDVILLDVMMPGISGIEACGEMRKTLPHTLPIVIVSATAVDEVIADAYKAGCSDFMAKPLQKNALMSRLQALLNTKRLHEAEQTGANKEEVASSELRNGHVQAFFRAWDVGNRDLRRNAEDSAPHPSHRDGFSDRSGQNHCRRI
eukprot:CAMPEP_0117493892 /NCGR_PEP_ID=MMETSP0784-20121206/19329_1 /TAXON_ID=39447 /ORGANISM="" /LENGTH=701 /DNA_ID=CAMNT_0005288753 /DNA_START=228 /DNA_END=2334 /DNA_ORIENTATION=+